MKFLFICASLFLMWCILFTAAAPPDNKSDEEKEDKNEQPGPESSLRYSRLLRRPGCVAREACEPHEDPRPEAQPKYEGKGKQTKGQRVKSKSRGNAPSAPSTSRGTGNEGRKPFPLRWPKDCRGHNCMSKCREPGTQFNRKLFWFEKQFEILF